MPARPPLPGLWDLAPPGAPCPGWLCSDAPPQSCVPPVNLLVLLPVLRLLGSHELHPHPPVFLKTLECETNRLVIPLSHLAPPSTRSSVLGAPAPSSVLGAPHTCYLPAVSLNLPLGHHACGSGLISSPWITIEVLRGSPSPFLLPATGGIVRMAALSQLLSGVALLSSFRFTLRPFGNGLLPPFPDRPSLSFPFSDPEQV